MAYMANERFDLKATQNPLRCLEVKISETWLISLCRADDPTSEAHCSHHESRILTFRIKLYGLGILLVPLKRHAPRATEKN
jgi:hypothetical protein